MYKRHCVKASFLFVCLLYVAAARPLPYPPSRVLAGLTWTSEPRLYPGIHSDMHWQTWCADDAIYSVDGDGSFPGTKEYYGSLSRITGMPPDHRIELVTQFPELRLREDHTPEGMRRYFCGPCKAAGANGAVYSSAMDTTWPKAQSGRRR